MSRREDRRVQGVRHAHWGGTSQSQFKLKSALLTTYMVVIHY